MNGQHNKKEGILFRHLPVVSRGSRQMDNNEISYKILITEFVFIRFNPDLYDSTFTYSIQRINGPVSSEFLLKINKG